MGQRALVSEEVSCPDVKLECGKHIWIELHTARSSTFTDASKWRLRLADVNNVCISISISISHRMFLHTPLYLFLCTHQNSHMQYYRRSIKASEPRTLSMSRSYPAPPLQTPPPLQSPPPTRETVTSMFF